MATRSRRRTVLTGLIAGVATVALALGGGVAFAYFTASAGGNGTVSTKSVTITSTGFPTLNATYINTLTTLTQNGSFTVSNTGQTDGNVSVSISSADPLAAKLPIRVWPQSVAACSAATPASAASGTWASVNVTPTATSLNVGQSITYCVRTTVTDRTTLAFTTGDQTAVATLSATLAGGGWTASATATTSMQQTDDIYPLDGAVVPASTVSRWFTIKSASNTSMCADVTGSSTSVTNGYIISYGCGVNANQRFKLIPVAESNSTLVTIAPKHAPGLRIGVTSAGVQQLAATNTSDLAQQWYLQTVGGTAWQIVSASTGKCLIVKSLENTGSHTTADCNTADAKLVLTREPLTFTPGTSGFTVGLTATQGTTGVAVQRWTGLVWVNVATGVNVANVSVPAYTLALLPNFTNGTNLLRIAYSTTNTDILYDSFQVNWNSSTNVFTPIAGFS